MTLFLHRARKLFALKSLNIHIKNILFISIFFVSSSAFTAPIVTNKIPYCATVPTLEMNMAQPANVLAGQTYPAIMFIHGGGWMAGDKSDFDGKIVEVAKQDYIGVTVSYRLTSTPTTVTSIYTDPRYKVGAEGYELVHDVKCALQFLKNNASQYNIDATKIGVTGVSAGAHLALMLGLSNEAGFNQSLGFPAGVDLSVAAIADWFGPTSDLPNIDVVTRPSLAERFLGCTYDAANQSWIEPATPLVRPDGTTVSCVQKDKELAPIHHIDATDPPLMILQGGVDTTVDKSQSILLNHMATNVHSFHFFPTMGHHSTNEGWLEVISFFDIHLKGIVDTQAPIVSPPANLVIANHGLSSVDATAPEIVSFLQEAHAFDNAGIVGSVSNDAPAVFSLGETLVTFSATDQAGHTGQATATVTVGDAAASSQASTGGGCMSVDASMLWWISLFLLFFQYKPYKQGNQHEH